MFSPAPRWLFAGIALVYACVLSGVIALNEDVIEDVNKQGLEKLLEDNDLVAVIFCKLQ